MDSNQQRVMGTLRSNTNNDDSNEEEDVDDDCFNVDGVPQNPALDCIPHAMSLAHAQYQKRFSNSSSKDDDKQKVILFVVQDGETNTVDQRMLEMKLWENYQIPVVRMSLTRAHTHIQLDESTGTLYVQTDDEDCDSKKEISVVYFRAGYAPTDYPDGYDGIEWQSRKKLEQSRATKCPCLGYHLAGTKKVQQELARQGSLEQFFDNETLKDDLRSAFAGLFSLGEDASDADLAAVKDAVSSIDQDGNISGKNYVLKPQREGGGYNFYGLDLVKKLNDNIVVTGEDDDNDSDQIKLDKNLSEFILMQRLFPPEQRSILLRSGIMEGTGDSISELGCFGTVLATHDGTILHNEYAGFLLRTKFSNVDEGGVASGFATLSSPYLC
jgi:glutathione synthetase